MQNTLQGPAVKCFSFCGGTAKFIHVRKAMRVNGIIRRGPMQIFICEDCNRIHKFPAK